MKVLLTIALFCTLTVVSQAGLSGAQVITPEDYPIIGPSAPNNPPFCGMPYASLDLDRITAVEDLVESECGSCIQVCSKSGKCGYALVVDMGGDGLDLSTGLFKELFGQDVSPEYATWHQVANSHCAGIQH